MSRIFTPRDIFSLDLRAIAFYRVSLAVLLIYDLLSRMGDIAAFYTDWGLLPRATHIEKFGNSFHISLHMAGGKTPFIVALFVVHLIAAIALLIGYRTRIASFLCWLLLISLHSRNPMILNGGDVLFRMAFFWGMFLPLHAKWSVDAALNTGPKPESNKWLGAAGVALIVQLMLLYLTTAILKDGKEWFPEGTASYYALALEQFTTPFGMFMSQWHDMLQASTYLVFALEYAAAPLLICPFFFPQVRTITIIALVIMHMQFDLTMRIGLFPWVDSAMLLALMPTSVWDWVERKFRRSDEKEITLFYDGACGFCRRMVHLMRTFLILPDAKIETSQDDEQAAEVLEKEYSWALKTPEGEYKSKWEALVTIGELSPLTGPVVRHLPMRDVHKFGDWIYDKVANNRDRLGTILAKLMQFREMPDLRPKLITNLVVTFLIGYVIVYNMRGIDKFNVSMSKPWRVIAYTLRLDQKWNMFAPYPLKNDGYFVVDGTLRSGKKVDAYARIEEEVSWKKPDVVSWQHKNARWRKYMMNIWQKKKKDHRLYWGKYTCRSWNDDRGYSQKLSNFTLNFIRERTMPPGEPPELKKYTIWRHDCFKKS